MAHAHHGTPLSISATHPSIANEINVATRDLHTELNRLVIDRLPLALPLHTHSPARYAIGIRRFAAIFLAIEHEFDLLALKSAGDEREHDKEVRAWLESLLPDGLRRSQRFLDDLEHLQVRTGVSKDISQNVAKEQKRLHSLVETRPHVLVAYVWIMYMAIFSGGRYIRRQLASPGEAFWSGHDARKSEKESLDVPGFAFLSFDDDEDGETLKVEFKRRLNDADGLLTPDERHEVVEEGKALFKHCIAAIKGIDKEVMWFESVAVVRTVMFILGILLLWIFWKPLVVP